MSSAFKPHPLCPGGQLQTVIAYLWPDSSPVSPDEQTIVPLSDGDAIVLDINHPAVPSPRTPIIYLMHGLGGDSDSSWIPLETGGGAANNRGPAFRLFALPGITAEEFRQRKTNRTNLEAAVLRLGEQWQKQERGPSNFSKPGWEKYTGR